jgi:hypothetical protein
MAANEVIENVTSFLKISISDVYQEEGIETQL